MSSDGTNGEAAPELSEYRAAFDDECFEMFGSFYSNVSGFEEAENAMYEEEMNDPVGMAMGMYW